MDIKKLSDFLKVAKKNTYASATAKKVKSQRPGSRDYEYSVGDLLYHDTFFGSLNFIGEEVVYEGGKPVWAMNYNGYTDPGLTEEEIDKSLRGALGQEKNDLIPVRGPSLYVSGNCKYTNKIRGDLKQFEGREEIEKDGKLVYFAVFHGGLIK